MSPSMWNIPCRRCPIGPSQQKLSGEKEVLGIYVTGHPLDEYSEKWRNYPRTTPKRWKAWSAAPKSPSAAS